MHRPSTRNPVLQDAADIVTEIREIRERIEADSRRIYDLAQALHQKARRMPAGASVNTYIMYANAWTRFAGMAIQGMRRTLSTERYLTPVLEQDAVEALPLKKAKAEEKAAPVYKSPLPPSDDLVEVFGEELAHASE